MNQFYKIQTRGRPTEVLHVAKAKTFRKWELNISDKDFFVGRCCGNKYTMSIKYHQKYIIYERSLKGDANSHLSSSL